MSTKRTLLAAGTAGVIGVTGIVGLGTMATAADDDAPAPGGEQTLSSRVDRIVDRLSGLVEDGTIDEEQAEAVAEELAEQTGPGRGHGWGHRMGEALALGLETAAETLGLTEDEVRAAVQDGTTLAELAEAQGVETQTLVDALVAAAEERVAEAVADGSLTQEQADAILAGVEERISAHVEEGFTGRGMGHGRGMGAGGFGPMGGMTDGDADTARFGGGGQNRGGWDA